MKRTDTGLLLSRITPHLTAQHGETYMEAGRYSGLIDLFVEADRLLRSLYGIEGCIWGDLGCEKVSPTGYVPALCEGCVTGSSRED